MNSSRERGYLWPWFLAFLLTLSLAPLMLAQDAGKASKRAKSRDDSDVVGIIRPTLLNADTDPTLRFPILSMPGSVFTITYGWLDISRNSVRYQVVEPPRKADHAFEVQRAAINDLHLNGSVIWFRSPKKKQMVFYLPQDRWGSTHTAPGVATAAVRDALGTGSIYHALQNFDDMLAMVKPPAPAAPVTPKPVTPPPPEPKPSAPPSPPAIMLASPAGAGANKVVEVQESPLVVRGVAMDNTGIPVVSINGSPVSMRPQSAQAAEFWSDPVTLQPGDNRLEIVASNTAHVEAKLSFLVHYTPKAAPPNPRALGKQDVLSLLQGSVPSGRIAEIIQDRGIKFAPSAEDIAEIRAAGGDDELIKAIQQAAGRGH